MTEDAAASVLTWIAMVQHVNDSYSRCWFKLKQQYGIESVSSMLVSNSEQSRLIWPTAVSDYHPYNYPQTTKAGQVNNSYTVLPSADCQK